MSTKATATGYVNAEGVLHLDFLPCSEICPAITGQPHGSVRYCPMQAPHRHRSTSDEEHPDYTDCCRNFQCCINHI